MSPRGGAPDRLTANLAVAQRNQLGIDLAEPHISAASARADAALGVARSKISSVVKTRKAEYDAVNSKYIANSLWSHDWGGERGFLYFYISDDQTRILDYPNTGDIFGRGTKEEPYVICSVFGWSWFVLKTCYPVSDWRPIFTYAVLAENLDFGDFIYDLAFIQNDDGALTQNAMKPFIGSLTSEGGAQLNNLNFAGGGLFSGVGGQYFGQNNGWLYEDGQSLIRDISIENAFFPSASSNLVSVPATFGACVYNSEFNNVNLHVLANGDVCALAVNDFGGNNYLYSESSIRAMGVATFMSSRLSASKVGLSAKQDVSKFAFYNVEVISCADMYGNLEQCSSFVVNVLADTGFQYCTASGFVEAYETDAAGFVGTASGNGTVLDFVGCKNNAQVIGLKAAGFLAKAEIGSDVTFERSQNLANVYQLMPAESSAGFVAIAEGKVSISNCENSGEISTLEGTNFDVNLGGFIGLSSGDVSVTSSRNNGIVFAAQIYDYATRYYIGGFVGLVSGKTSLTNCTNNSNLFSNESGSTSIDIQPTSTLGGIVGMVYSSSEVNIEGCINRGNLFCRSSDWFYSIGGIVGANSINASGLIKISNCKNSGQIISGTHQGGIIGFSSQGELKVLNCTNTGDLKYAIYMMRETTTNNQKTERNGGSFSAGIGIVLDSNVTIDNCINNASIVAMPFEGNEKYRYAHVVSGVLKAAYSFHSFDSRAAGILLTCRDWHQSSPPPASVAITNCKSYTRFSNIGLLAGIMHNFNPFGMGRMSIYIDGCISAVKAEGGSYLGFDSDYSETEGILPGSSPAKEVVGILRSITDSAPSRQYDVESATIKNCFSEISAENNQQVNSTVSQITVGVKNLLTIENVDVSTIFDESKAINATYIEDLLRYNIYFPAIGGDPYAITVHNLSENLKYMAPKSKTYSNFDNECLTKFREIYRDISKISTIESDFSNYVLNVEVSADRKYKFAKFYNFSADQTELLQSPSDMETNPFEVLKFLYTEWCCNDNLDGGIPKLRMFYHIQSSSLHPVQPANPNRPFEQDRQNEYIFNYLRGHFMEINFWPFCILDT